MSTESYAVEICRYCKEQNRIYLGRMDDITGVDVDGFKCWACEEDQFLSDLGEHRKEYIHAEDPAWFGHCVDGKPPEPVEVQQLKERVRWLEEGLRLIEQTAVVEPVTGSGSEAYADPHDIRRIAGHYLKGKE